MDMLEFVANLGAGLERAVVLVISKSGGTVETRNGMLEMKYAYEKRGLSFASHAVAITCQGSKLDNLAAEQGWLKRFPLWDWVGGRTSIFSAVGLIPAALQGVAIDEFLEGAKAMDELTRNKERMKNPAALMAMMWYYAGNGKGEKDLVVLPYKDRLCLFSKYLQQLIMESLGKERDLEGNCGASGLSCVWK